jgi:hypothetical protein
VTSADPALGLTVPWTCPPPGPDSQYLHFTSAERAARITAMGVLVAGMGEWPCALRVGGIRRRGALAHATSRSLATGLRSMPEAAKREAAVLFRTELAPDYAALWEVHWRSPRLPLVEPAVLDWEQATSLLSGQLHRATREPDGRVHCSRCWSCRLAPTTEEAPVPGPLAAAVPDVAALSAELARRRDGARLRLHGPAHWRQVATAGLRLCQAVPDADPVVVYCFAVLHDAARLDDAMDPAHGSRAAGWLSELGAAGLLQLGGGQVAVLRQAIRDPSGGQVTDHPTVGCAGTPTAWTCGAPSPGLGRSG